MNATSGARHYSLSSWRIPLCALMAWIAAGGPALAQSAATTLAQRHPAGSIQSIDIADQALLEARNERQRVEQRFTREEYACYEKFLANACVQEAKERRRLALTEIRSIEVEANAFKRRARVEEHDRQAREKFVQPESGAGRSEENRKPHGSGHAEDAMRNASDTKSGQEVQQNRSKERDQRVVRHEARLARLKAGEAADARKRAENIAAHQKKVEEAAARQRKIAERKSEQEKNQLP